MNDLKVIFVNWTRPFFFKEDAQGYNKLKMFNLPDFEYDVVDYELLIQKVAVLSAKKNIGRTKLYTDKIGYDFYNKKGMLKLWDEVDVDVLEKFNQDYPEVAPGRFWTSGKSIVMGQEPTPYLFLDLDFIVRESLPQWIWHYDVVHTQWEVQRGEFFVFEWQLDEIGGIEDFVQNMMMPNTSFVYMNNEDIRDDYLKKHLSIITRKYKQIPEWLWLLADQGILGYSIRKFKGNVETIENRIYMSYPELPVKDNNLVGKGLFWVKDPDRRDHLVNLKYEHIWLDKYYFKTDQKYREIRVKELEDELEDLINPDRNKIITKRSII
jgi:hypothetical protein